MARIGRPIFFPLDIPKKSEINPKNPKNLVKMPYDLCTSSIISSVNGNIVCEAFIFKKNVANLEKKERKFSVVTN